MAVASIKGSAGNYQTWTRPADWLTLPTVNVGDQKIVGLVHVLPGAVNTLLAFSIAGAYTVDWGDGTAAQNVATGVLVTHSYDPTTLGAGTLTSDGYKQAIVTITMQAANTMTAVDFSRTPTGASSGYANPWRDIAMAGASVNALTLSSAAGPNQTRWFSYVGPSAIASMSQAGLGMYWLRGFSGTQWTASVTNFNFWIPNSAALETVPLFDLTSCTNVNQMFQGCSRLRSVPLFNTSNVTNFTSMFNGCASLTSVPLFDTSKGTAFNSMFTGCVSLVSVPLINTAAGITFNSMFNNCSTLPTIPALDLGNATSLNSMFSGCTAAVTWPAAFNTAKCTDFTSMFSGCALMITHPTMTVSLGTLFSTMFNGCSSLAAVNLPTSSAGTAFVGLVQSCVSMKTINVNMTASASSANSLLVTAGTGIAGITSLVLTGLRFATSATSTTQNEQMNAAALNALYTSLGTASGAQTLVVSGNPGSGSSTISIATAKGWTVTGG